jgi:CMP-N-acetylneuraminic acid synthetase
MSAMKIIAMIPARLGSQRLKQKNLRTIAGAPLIVHAIRKCKAAEVFDEIWVNTEADEIGQYARQEGVGYHKRSPELANNQATSEDFVEEFLQKHSCDYVVQVHSIAPLLTVNEVREFVELLKKDQPDALFSTTAHRLECLCEGKPVNFTFQEKTNSQDLAPVQEITWSITAWRRKSFLAARSAGSTATYAGNRQFFPVDRLAGLVIKTEVDLQQAEALWSLVHR